MNKKLTKILNKYYFFNKIIIVCTFYINNKLKK